MTFDDELHAGSDEERTRGAASSPGSPSPSAGRRAGDGARSSAPDDVGPLVLILDANSETWGLVEQALSRDHRVLAVAGTEHADLAAELQPDAIVCEVATEGGGGERLVQRLRADPRTADIPIIAVTGGMCDDLGARLLCYGTNDFVTRPFTAEELRARIDNLIANRREIADLTLKVREAERVTEQLQHAFDSRVVIEQAKGVLAAERKTDLDSAFESLRSYARFRRARLRDVAESVVRDGLRW